MKCNEKGLTHCSRHRKLTCSATWIPRTSSTKLVIVAVVSFPCTKSVRLKHPYDQALHYKIIINLGIKTGEALVRCSLRIIVFQTLFEDATMKHEHEFYYVRFESYGFISICQSVCQRETRTKLRDRFPPNSGGLAPEFVPLAHTMPPSY